MRNTKGTNQELKKALLTKLKCTPQALSQRAKRLKGKLPMPTALAVYVIAHREGIGIDRYLDKETVSDVRRVLRELPSETPEGPRTATRKTRAPAERRVSIKLPELQHLHYHFLTPPAADHCKRMGELYPYVYVFENSLRGFIREVLQKKVGQNWWEKAAPTLVRQKVQKRMDEHGKNAWHSSTSANPLSYADIGDLTKIINKNSALFAPLFEGIEDGYRWLTTKTNHIELHRNVIAHNNPLSRDNAEELKRYCKQWQLLARKIKETLDAS